MTEEEIANKWALDDGDLLHDAAIEAMKEYSKQECIEFALWINQNCTSDQYCILEATRTNDAEYKYCKEGSFYEFTTEKEYTIEELYELYLKSKV